MGLPVRALVALAATVPAGAMMGFGFPTGMTGERHRPPPDALVLGGERLRGVLAASVAVGTSIAFSINASLWIGAARYVLLVPVAIALRRMQTAPIDEMWLAEDRTKLEITS